MVEYSKKTEWHVSGMSSSGSDFQPDGTEDEYVAEIENPRNPKTRLRGNMAFQAAWR